MGVPEVNGSIGSLLNFYKQEKRIFGCCPSCGEPFRLSDVKLTYGREPPRDIITKLQAARDRLKEELEEMESALEELRQQHEDERQGLADDHQYQLENLNDQWRGRVDNEVDRQLLREKKQIRKLAIAQSRAVQLGKTLEKVVPMFPGFGHHPYDVRPVFDPVDFVVFDGYFQGEVNEITFVEFKTGQARLNNVQESIRATVARKQVRFETRRLSKEAMRMLTEGKFTKVPQIGD